MRNYCFEVVFVVGGSEQVYAGCEATAIILAQAKRINKGLEYTHIKELYVLE